MKPKLTAYLVFFSLLAIHLWLKISFHECWKDEWQAWFVARDMSWLDMLDFLSYEGHPALWYVWLKSGMALSSLFPLSDADQLKILHTLPWAASLWVLIFRMKFPLWLSLAMALSFFFWFEYGMVSRGYILLILLALLLTLALEYKGYSVWFTGALFFLLCQTEVYGAFFSLAFLVYYFVRTGQINGWRQITGRLSFRVYAAAVILGWLVLIWSIFPETQSTEYGFAVVADPLALESIGKAFQGNLANAFLPGVIPDTSGFGVTAPGILLSVVLLVSIPLFFRKNRAIQCSWLAFWAMMFLFSLMVYQGGIRHWGLQFIFFMLLLTLYGMDQVTKPVYQFILPAILITAGLAYAGRATYRDVTMPYTNAKITSAFLEEKVPSNVPILSLNKFTTTPLVGYLERPVYALPEGVTFTYFRWLDKIYVPTEHELWQFANYKQVGGLVVVTDKPVDAGRYPTLKLWKSFDQFNLRMENFHVYLFDTKEYQENNPQ